MCIFSHLPEPAELKQNAQITEALILAHRHLGELKGLVRIIPNEKILLTNLTLQEAKDSSAIENIITTQDSLYEHQIQPNVHNTSNKEVYRYSKALEVGVKKIKLDNGISCNTILQIQRMIEPDRPGFRKVVGTVLKDTRTKKVIYTPPSPEKIPKLMHRLEIFMHDNSIDPIVKMAIVHHCFESIHPFYDGNGRTGRIINILYLVLNQLIDSPVLYLSRYILKSRSSYYKLLQKVREENDWTSWILYMLKAVSVISQETSQLITTIDQLFKEYKNTIRKNHKFYSHDLINNIFAFPYTKVKFLQRDLKLSRSTATRYLDALSKDKILTKHKIGKESYYVNERLFDILKDS